MSLSEPTVAELLNSGKPTFSFEFFPPRDEAGVEMLWKTVKNLKPLNPDFISVTYGASGSRRDNSIEVTRRMAASSFRTIGHLTCVSQTREHLEKMVDDYGSVGVSHILAIRGDMPGGPTVPWEQHPEGLANATELVKLIKSRGDYCVGVAAFPELHPENRDADLDVKILCDKQEAGAEFAVTQLFFDAHKYFELVDRARKAGCTMPIVAGLMPLTRVSQIERFAEMSGAPLPKWMVDRVMEVADDPAAVAKVGEDITADLAEELLRGGAPGIHFYTQNRSAVTRRVLTGLHERGW